MRLAPAFLGLVLGLGFAAGGAGCSTGERPRSAAREGDVRATATSAPGAAPAAPRFALAERNGVWWLIDPAGEAFFSLGVCVVDRGIAREAYDPAKPGYAAWRHYPDGAAWADATLGRLRAWGFTTIGGWSDAAELRRAGGMDLVLIPVLAAGMEAGVPWFDLWDPNVVARVEELARERILAARDYPRLLGYYTDNEMGWWNGALFKMTLEHPASSGQRQRLLQLLRDHYGGEWRRLLEDFDPEGAGDFDGLEKKGALYLRPGGDGIRVARRFLELVAERYYDVLDGIVRRYDPRGLNLGDRYQSFYYPEVARAAGRRVDAVSTNLNAPWSDGTFPRFYLDTLRDLSGKPVIVSEFYLSASENRSGNRNDRGVFPVARTQRERADGCRRTLAALLDLPHVVGADWFQYYDEPPGGRGDGENFNFGLVDIDDRPYEELVVAFRGLDAAARHARAGGKRPDATGGVPPAPAGPFADFEPNRALGAWDRERGFVPPTSRYPLADLYVAWGQDALYLGLFALDPVEEAYYRDGQVPEADRMQWSVGVDGLEEPVMIRLGAGRPPAGVPEGAEAISLSGTKLGVRVIAALRLPAALIGRPRLGPGDRFRLDARLTTHARAHSVDWKGELGLSP